jgi:hypothetical protein
MGLDIRTPIGAMFTILGAILSVYGFLTSGDAELYRHSLGLNVNLWWGLVLLLFGIVMLLLGRNGKAAVGGH